MLGQRRRGRCELLSKFSSIILAQLKYHADCIVCEESVMDVA
jgi:hypothetical protein